MAVDPSRSRQQSAPAFVSDFCDRIASLVFDDSHHRVFYSGTCADVERRVCYTVDAGIVFTFLTAVFCFPNQTLISFLNLVQSPFAMICDGQFLLQMS